MFDRRTVLAGCLCSGIALRQAWALHPAGKDDPQVDAFVETWLQARLENCRNPLLRQAAERRRDFLSVAAAGPSMLPKTRLHPRMMQWYVSVRIPFKGDVSDHLDVAGRNRRRP